MKKHITFFLIPTFLFFNSICFSQNRTNDPLPIISKNIGQVLDAQGWFKNSSGQWISRKNKIISDLGSSTKLLENYEKYSTGQDNFISFERKDIIIKIINIKILIDKHNFRQ